MGIISSDRQELTRLIYQQVDLSIPWKRSRITVAQFKLTTLIKLVAIIEWVNW